MTPIEYFKDWYPYIDLDSLKIIFSYLQKQEYYPEASKVFRAFKITNKNNTKIIFLGQDPYPQKNMATGLAFANPSYIPEDNLSPSLQILKEAAINYTIPHSTIQFDQTLETWATQGILLLNSSLTVKPYTPGSHSLYWRSFISHFLEKFSKSNPGIIYVLFGKTAQSFKTFINNAYIVYEVEHPAALARQHKKLPSQLFYDIASSIKTLYNEELKWFHELT